MGKKKIIIFGRWTEIITELRKEDNPTMLQMSKDLNITYSHVSTIVKELERLKWVTSSKEGRVRIIKLTKIGEEMKQNIIPILKEIKKKRDKNESINTIY